MKKILILVLVTILVFAFLISCRKKVEDVPAPPPKPQEIEQPKVEKVEEVPPVKEPELTEEEIFMAKSLEEINEEMPLNMIHFDFDKYFIREDAKPILQQNARWLKKFPTVKILIEGHCDERGTEEYNLALGEKRARSTYDYFISLGVGPNRMRTISYGKSQPIDLGHNEISWQKNRRSQFTIFEK
ncbi:MAG: peptidoglycan-associated lipoprotein Pal [Candidatus Aminicenantes bacterium]|nr:peptidoglycan-associated lipoprotein Pal [Candidatus Aminicenantes bacterium]